MIKIPFFIYFILICSLAQAQLKPIDVKTLPTKRQRLLSETNTHCKTHNKYSVDQRRGFYPFSISNRIELISYTWPDSVVMGGEIPMKNGYLNTALVRERKILSTAQTDSLTQILYNVGYKGHFFTEVDIKCYNPRNAIVFFDTRGKLAAFIELCFECQKYRVSSQKIRTGDFCVEKYELLREFFSKVGIEYGTKERGLE